MKSEYQQNPCPLCETFGEPDTSFHTIHNDTFSTKVIRHGKSMFIITKEISLSKLTQIWLLVLCSVEIYLLISIEDSFLYNRK